MPKKLDTLMSSCDRLIDEYQKVWTEIEQNNVSNIAHLNEIKKDSIPRKAHVFNDN
jgi:hypothetical protein